ncbi:hypothetical protein OSB04_031294 [Centaurea solstitialis]|uniref:Uncharacterized protein n=1 Tax=Centaurea solstitialis TaxID=347529 RepID=A0AA38SMD3_9ASTR|nr:hypothetical protein OSB04_031294 [Centaurea solstitialis]
MMIHDFSINYFNVWNHLEGRRKDYIKICLPLYEASVVGDWEAAENMLSINCELDLLGYSITQDKETTLHIGLYSQNIKFVKKLVDRMTDQQLTLQDKNGQTALSWVAGAGNVHMARIMVERCPQLLTIRDKHNWLPITMAAVCGKRNMVAYLYGKYKSMEGNDWTCEDIHVVFSRCIEADLFDSALKILDDQNNRIGFPEQACAGGVLYILARKTYAFKDVKSWKNSSKC